MARQYCFAFITIVLLSLFTLLFREAPFPVSQSSSIRQESHEYKLLVVVPGFSFQNASLKLVLNNVKALSSRSSVDTSCVIYHYVYPTHVHYENMQSAEARELQHYCKFSTYLGSDYAFYIKAVNPNLITMVNYSHVMILLDDVELRNFAVDRFLDIMTFNNLTSASPAIKQGQFPCNRQENLDSVGGTSVAIEVFATFFTAESFDCFWSLLDPHVNFIGWGYDLFFPTFCAAMGHPQRLGVVTYNDMQAIHRPVVAKGKYTPRAGVNASDIFALAARQEAAFRDSVQQRYGLSLADPAELREKTYERPRDYEALRLPPRLASHVKGVRRTRRP
jgi:hypothetical protein